MERRGGWVGPTRLIVQHIGMDTQLECRVGYEAGRFRTLRARKLERSYNRVLDRSFVYLDKNGPRLARPGNLLWRF